MATAGRRISLLAKEPTKSLMDTSATNTWTKVSEGPWSKRRKHQVVVWNENQLLLLGGFDGESALDLNDVWSWNGESWTVVTAHAPWSGRDGHCVVVLNNYLYLLGGTDDPYFCKNDVWRSDDGGRFWLLVNPSSSWPERWQHASCSHNGYIYVSGGWGGKYYNDIWRSEDGIEWTSISQNCPWKPRMFLSMISFKGTLYIIGGHDGRSQLNDVWASSDGGYTWTEVCGSAVWEPRQGHVTVAYEGHVYLMGGFGGSVRFNDLWKSDDCAHWKLVSKNCDWTPRQGHACAVFHSNLCVIGGFDEGGYCNNMYSMPLPSVSTIGNSISNLNLEAHEADGINSSKIVTVSMTCATDMISKLAEARSERDRIIFKITKLIDLVMSAVNYQYHEKSAKVKNVSNLAISSTSGTPATLSPIVQQIRKSRNSDTSCLSNSGLLQKFSNLSQPLLMSEPLWVVDPNLNKSMDLSDTDEVKIGSSSTDSLDLQISNETDLIGVSSAQLREDMENQRKKLVQLQKKIREHAETGEIEIVNGLVEERQTLSTSSIAHARKLFDHTLNLIKLQMERQQYLEKVYNKLRSLQLFNSSNSTNLIFKDSEVSNSRPSSTEYLEEGHCSLSDWHSILDEYTIMVNNIRVSTENTDNVIGQFRESLKQQSEICLALSAWTEMMLIPNHNVNDTPRMPVQNELTLNSPTACDELIKIYKASNDSIDKMKMKIKSSVDKELVEISSSNDDLIKFLKLSQEKSIAFLGGLISQNRIDIMEISSMTSEVENWLNRLTSLSNSLEIQVKCDDLIKQNAILESNLIRLEDERIDIKSALEKAALRRHAASLSAANKASVEFENLSKNLAKAEQNVRDARRTIRNWYRETRKFAVDYAPELFFYIPDLRSAGSVLGDGGFAEKSKLPRRKFEEYENVRSITEDVKSTKSFGRHLLLRATYDNEEVVLKGFVMHEGDQRKGLEREISILGKLRHDCIISPNAIVEGSTTPFDSKVQVTIFIEYPFYRGGNLSAWLQMAPRKPWDFQNVAQQLLYGINCLHDHGVIHKDIKPSNVLLDSDGRVVLTDFELSKEVTNSNDEETSTTIAKVGTKGFMAPEVEAGQQAVFASDMYSFGVLLYYMHFPNQFSQLVPGHARIPSTNDTELTDLLSKLLDINPSQRPTANGALMHPYFRTTFAEKLLRDGEVVEQDRKLEAVRSMLNRCRSENRTNIERITIHRNSVVSDVLEYFRNSPLERIKASLKVTFVGEPGVDEGGLLTELFSIFYEAVFNGEANLFESSESKNTDPNLKESETMQLNSVVLPTSKGKTDPEVMQNLRAFGRIMVKTLFEGRRIGNKLCPSVFKFITSTSPNIRDLQIFDRETARSLQWTLATVGVEEFGLNFESVGAPELGPVDDVNKSKFVTMKINQIMVESRRAQLSAIKLGFTEAMAALSVEAAPFLSLLSHADWRVFLCGDMAINGALVASRIRYQGFPSKSKTSAWLKEILLAASEDHLRQFLVFTTGSPSIPSTMVSSSFEITVRCQTRSSSLPIAHTCFFQLDIPDYPSKEVLQAKLLYAIQNSNSFEIV